VTPIEEALRQLWFRLDQFTGFLRGLKVDSKESAALMEEFRTRVQAIRLVLEEADGHFDEGYTKLTEWYTGQVGLLLNSVTTSLTRVQEAYEKAIRDYDEGRDEVVNQLEEQHQEPTPFTVEDGQRLFGMVEGVRNELAHLYVMGLAELTVRSFLSVLPKVETVLSGVTMTEKDASKTYEGLLQAQDAFQTIPRGHWKALGIDGIDEERLDVLAKTLRKPASRPKNVMLNTLITFLVDGFLASSYSKRKAYLFTGQLLVKYGLIEDSPSLSDRIRHRYDRCKAEQMMEDRNES
jgi:hypothetical protein